MEFTSEDTSLRASRDGRGGVREAVAARAAPTRQRGLHSCSCSARQQDFRSISAAVGHEATWPELKWPPMYRYTDQSHQVRRIRLRMPRPSCDASLASVVKANSKRTQTMDATGLPRELLGHLAVLVFSSCVIMGSPGPSTLSAMSVAAAFGLHRAANYVFGLIVGTTVVLLVVALGLFTFITALPRLNAIVAAIATAYVLFLAYKIATAPPIGEVAQVRQPSFRAAAALAMANPKAYLAIASVFGGTILLADHQLDVILKLVALTIMIVVIHLAWMLGGVSLARRLRDPRAARLVNLTMGVLLAASALRPFLN